MRTGAGERRCEWSNGECSEATPPPTAAPIRATLPPTANVPTSTQSAPTRAPSQAGCPEPRKDRGKWTCGDSCVCEAWKGKGKKRKCVGCGIPATATPTAPSTPTVPVSPCAAVTKSKTCKKKSTWKKLGTKCYFVDGACTDIAPTLVPTLFKAKPVCADASSKRICVSKKHKKNVGTPCYFDVNSGACTDVAPTRVPTAIPTCDVFSGKGAKLCKKKGKKLGLDCIYSDKICKTKETRGSES